MKLLIKNYRKIYLFVFLTLFISFILEIIFPNMLIMFIMSLILLTPLIILNIIVFRKNAEIMNNKLSVSFGKIKLRLVNVDKLIIPLMLVTLIIIDFLKNARLTNEYLIICSLFIILGLSTFKIEKK